jgi:hypothetical protein
MNNQTDLFAKKITQRLNEGLSDIEPHIQQRLNVARNIAISKSTQNNATHVGSNQLALNLAYFKSKINGFAVLLLLILAMVSSIQYTQIQATADEAADLDAEILSDDTPVQAYTDPVFSLVFRSGLLSNEK